MHWNLRSMACVYCATVMTLPAATVVAIAPPGLPAAGGAAVANRPVAYP